MKTIFRLLVLALMVSGWAVAALCVSVIRVPDPDNPQQSKLVVIPKQRLGIGETYVDARAWTKADVPKHAALILRMLSAEKAEQLKFLADAKSKENVEGQLVGILDQANGASTTRSGR